MKKVGWLLLILVFLGGCSNRIKQDDSIERIYLDSEYYGKGDFREIDSSFVDDNNGNYVLYVYNNYCAFAKPCDDVFKSFVDTYNVTFLKIPFNDFKNTKYYETIKYGPSIAIIQNGQIVDYLDANSDDDFDAYQDNQAFAKWLDKYIYFNGK